MQKTKIVKKTEKVTEIVDVICNICKKSCSNAKLKGHPHQFGYEGLVEAEVHGGYDSEVLGDMVSYRFSICEHCLNSKIFPLFKIPYDIKSHDYSGEYLPLKEYKKVVTKADKASKEEWIKAIIELKSFKKSELRQKTHSELYHIYHNLKKELKK